MRLQVCTLVSTNVILGRLGQMNSAQAEMAAMFQQVLAMLQKGSVRQHSRSLSMHSQVEPDGFNSQTTRVGHHQRVWVDTTGFPFQVIVDTTTSIVTFSILSPDACLSYDRIKLRLEEYRTLLASGSDTIELSTENGKIIICRKEAKEMEEYLGQAEILLGDVVQSRDISTLVVLHHLRNLAEVLDNLKLYDECRLTGNCALDLAEALSRRSLEFKQEQADTLALIAGLDAYEPRARTLFVQAVLICDEVVENDASHSNKYSLLYVLGRASSCVLDNAQWLERAVQLMTKEIPPTMVNPDFRSSVYTIYGNSLRRFDQYAHATEAYYESISIRRPLVNSNPAKHSYHFAQTLYNMGSTFHDLGEYGGAIAAYKEQLDICTVMSAQDPPRYNELMAITLIRYEDALRSLKRLPEAAAVEKQALSFCRKLAQTDDSWRDQLFAAT